MIDLRSDTVTKPTAGMLQAMMNAKVGDDVFGEDPTVKELEERVATLFGMETAVFCPSGTMTNQIAIKVHTQPGDEVICDRLSHVYNFEGGGIAFNSGASVRLLEGDRGRFTSKDVVGNINPQNDHYPVSRLVCVENTVNRGGGAYYHINQLKEIAETCRKHHLAYHLDGARLFNALAETKELPAEYGKIFDSISICLSKGLGAPVGSLLIGSYSIIAKARRIRKVFGGGMRQAGYLAAAGLYAIEHHVERLCEDHTRAHYLGNCIKQLPYVEELMPVETNIIIFKLAQDLHTGDFIKRMNEKGIHVLTISPQKIRMVTHLDYTDEMLVLTEKALR